MAESRTLFCHFRPAPRILVEHARRHNLKRRGDVQHASLEEEAFSFSGERAADLVALDDAINALAQIGPRKVQVVEMHFLAGLSIDETAEVLKVLPVTSIVHYNELARPAGCSPVDVKMKSGSACNEGSIPSTASVRFLPIWPIRSLFAEAPELPNSTAANLLRF